MNAFVLEDEPFRRDFFMSIGVDPSRIFDHPDRFIEAVQARDASQDSTLTIYLDHDLGCYVFGLGLTLAYLYATRRQRR